MAATIGQAYVQILPSMEGISGRMEDMLSPEAEKAGQKAGKSLTDAMGKSMGKVGKDMTKKVTLPIVGAFTGVVKTTADFDASMAKVKAITGEVSDDALPGIIEKANAMGLSFEEGANATETAFNIMRAEARKMGAETKFSASESAEAMNYMAMAGWKADQMIEGLPGILNLAAASGEDLATTSDIVTDALTAFGMNAEDAGHFADVLAAASSNANTNVSMMGESFKYVAPVAGALGYSAEDISIGLGLMANSGIKASQAGTTLRTILTNMSKPTDEMQAAMDALGVSLYDDEGKMYSFKEIMDQLRTGFGELMIPEEELTAKMAELDQAFEDGTMSEKQYNDAVAELTERAYGAEGAEKAKYAAMLGGSRSMSGMLAMVNATSEDYEKLTDAIYNADGAAEGMADVMQDTLSGQFTILLSQLQELAISFGDILVPVLRDVVTWFQGVVDKWNSMDESTKAMIIKIGLVVAAIGPVLTIGSKIISLISVVKTGLSLLGSAIGLLASPVGLVIAAIAAAIAIGVLLYKNWDKVKAKVTEIWDSIKKKASAIWESIKSAVMKPIEYVKTTMADVWEGIKTKAATVWEGIKNAITTPIEKAKDLVKSVVDKIRGFFSFNISWPHIPMPHFGISPAGWKVSDLLKGSIPKLSIDWYAQGAIMTKPVLFGGGEKGAEGIIPLDPFWKRMDDIQKTSSGNTTYNIGDVTLKVSDLKDVLTLEQFVEVVKRAKSFA